MQVEHVQLNFERKSSSFGFQYELFPPATTEEIARIEQRLDIEIPHIIVLFYSRFNGLEVFDPDLFILPIQNWSIDSDYLIHFATFDRTHRLCFDASRLNEAKQWSIIHCETRYFVTYTMSSFWTNKIWNWICKGRTVWKKEKYSF